MKEATEQTKELYGRVIGMVQIAIDNVHTAEIELKEKRAAMASAKAIRDMIESHYSKVR